MPVASLCLGTLLATSVPSLASERDVRRIEMVYHRELTTLTTHGWRHNVPYLNNISRSLYWLTHGFFGTNYYSCIDQVFVVRTALKKIETDARWSFIGEGRTFPLPHQWLKAVSSDPKDPVIVLDPWDNDFDLLPGAPPAGSHD